MYLIQSTLFFNDEEYFALGFNWKLVEICSNAGNMLMRAVNHPIIVLYYEFAKQKASTWTHNTHIVSANAQICAK